MKTLLPAPPTVEDEHGHPRFGTYVGSIPKIDLGKLRAPFQLDDVHKLVRLKRWLYTFIATPEVIAYFAVVNANYASNAFCMVVDAKTGKVLADESSLGLPSPFVHVGDEPAEGCEVYFRAPLAKYQVRFPKDTGRFQTDISLGVFGQSVSWHSALMTRGSMKPLTVVAPVAEGGMVNVTQKWVPLLASGTLESGGRRFILDGGIGGMDYTHGYLARHTAWKWGFACGRDAELGLMGFNLVEGFNVGREDVNENALWINGEVVPLGRAKFSYDIQDSMKKWEVNTECGTLSLTFRPLAAHSEFRNLGLIRSKFVQPVGFFEGNLKFRGATYLLQHLPGVTEDQDVLW